MDCSVISEMWEDCLKRLGPITEWRWAGKEVVERVKKSRKGAIGEVLRTVGGGGGGE